MNVDWRTAFRKQPHELQRNFHRMFAAKLEGSLDACHGECVLSRPELGQIVANSLLHFDGDFVVGALRDPTSVSQSDTATKVRYHVSDFVVMPNHVHVMICLFGRYTVARPMLFLEALYRREDQPTTGTHRRVLAIRKLRSSRAQRRSLSTISKVHR